MLEYLEKLVEERKWEEALAYAEQLLSTVDDDLSTLLRLNVAILRSRWEIGEFFGAQAIGQLCVKMARELEEWDQHGFSCLVLGTAFHRLGQYNAALETWFEYLSHLSKYTPNPQREARIRFNIGTTYAQIGDTEEALKALGEALWVAEEAGEVRHAHGIRHALTEIYIKQGNRTEVPRLLAQSLHFLHHHFDSTDATDLSMLWHFVMRAEFAMSTRRYERAQKVAKAGLSRAGDHHRIRVELEMILAHVAEAQGKKDAAIDHALSARVHAIACGRFDLELEAAEYMYHLLAET